MSIERKQRKQDIETAFANNAAIEAAATDNGHSHAPIPEHNGSPAFAKKSKKTPGSDKHHAKHVIAASS
jgi:hypothetical protein